MTSRSEADALKRPFLIGCIAVLIVMVVMGALISVFGTGADRAEGAAERWLVAVGDTTRKGVRDDAHHRAEKIGPVVLAEPLLPKVDTDGDSSFTDLEVGARRAGEGGTVRVPFRVHQFAESGEPPAVDGTLVLLRVDDDWELVAVEPRLPGELVPSEGGDLPSRAPLGAWIGAFVLGIGLSLGGSAVVKVAGRGTHAPVTAAQ